MMDLEIYRARIGQFNLKICVGYGKKAKLQCCRNNGQQCGTIVGVLVVASLILAMIVTVGVSRGSSVERDGYQSWDPGLSTLGNVLSFPSGPIRVQNYQLKISDWNSYMKVINGNTAGTKSIGRRQP